MNYSRILRYVLVPVAAFLMVCCYSEPKADSRPFLVEVDGSYLFKDEADLALAANEHADSVAFVNGYMEHWATEELFYSKAAENVPSTEEIERMVESYRKSLILNIYQEKLVEQHLKPTIVQDDVRRFYDANKNLFGADEALFKGLLVVLPAKAPTLSKVRKWCSQRDPESLEQLEAYCAENALSYDYYRDDWYPFAYVVKATPLTEFQLTERALRNNTVEFKENGNIYFVCTDTLLRKGETMPIELVSAEISELLLNSRKAEFIKRKKRELYNEAKAKGLIKFNNAEPVSGDINEK